MSSRIEQIIDEIDEFIESCKFQPLSATKIIVNKEEIEELLVELRLRIPEEIKKYQKDLLEYFDNVYPEIGKEIETTKQLSDELVEKIVKAAEEFRDKSR